MSSLSTISKHFNEIIGGHWAIKNKLQWCLDVEFKEDYSTRLTGNAAQNFRLITKMAINLLKNENSRKRSLKGKRLLCKLDETFLLIFSINKLRCVCPGLYPK